MCSRTNTIQGMIEQEEVSLQHSIVSEYRTDYENIRHEYEVTDTWPGGEFWIALARTKTTQKVVAWEENPDSL